MTRKPQNEATRGSQRWLQKLINSKPKMLSSAVAQQTRWNDPSSIRWLSPRKDDDYAEYVDEGFINKLDITLPHYPLNTFWPRNGPNWDGLGVLPASDTSSAKLLLIEAKSHLGEICSPACGAAGQSLRTIEASLNRTKCFLGTQRTVPWTKYFYQYTNRLAHLYLLRELNHLDAFLIFIYFLNDEDMGGPATEQEWRAIIALLERNLGLLEHPLLQSIVKVFIDVKELALPINTELAMRSHMQSLVPRDFTLLEAINERLHLETLRVAFGDRSLVGESSLVTSGDERRPGWWVVVRGELAYFGSTYRAALITAEIGDWFVPDRDGTLTPEVGDLFDDRDQSGWQNRRSPQAGEESILRIQRNTAALGNDGQS